MEELISKKLKELTDGFAITYNPDGKVIYGNAYISCVEVSNRIPIKYLDREKDRAIVELYEYISEDIKKFRNKGYYFYWVKLPRWREREGIVNGNTHYKVLCRLNILDKGFAEHIIRHDKNTKDYTEYYWRDNERRYDGRRYYKGPSVF